MTPSPTTLRRTPLAERHRARGARVAAADGWELPREFEGRDAEHLAVRRAAGLFDLSHLGEVEVAGRDAVAAVQRLTSNDAGTLGVGEAQRSALTSAAGTFLDDLLVFRLAARHFLLVTSAGAHARDVAWIVGQSASFDDAAVVDTSSRYVLLALQGPASADVLQTLTSVDLAALEPWLFTHTEVAGVRATVVNGGSTGERGYLVLAPPQLATRLWDALQGADDRVVPAGLDALDTLRLEAGVPAYGRELDENTTLLEAGLEGLVAWDKDFIGREALLTERASGARRRLVGFEAAAALAVPPERAHVLLGGARVGAVTSAARPASVGKTIGLAYMPAEHAAAGTEFEVDVEGRRARARVVPVPFYKRPKG